MKLNQWIVFQSGVFHWTKQKIQIMQRILTRNLSAKWYILSFEHSYPWFIQFIVIIAIEKGNIFWLRIESWQWDVCSVCNWNMAIEEQPTPHEILHSIDTRSTIRAMYFGYYRSNTHTYSINDTYKYRTQYEMAQQ